MLTVYGLVVSDAPAAGRAGRSSWSKRRAAAKTSPHVMVPESFINDASVVTTPAEAQPAGVPDWYGARAVVPIAQIPNEPMPSGFTGARSVPPIQRVSAVAATSRTPVPSHIAPFLIQKDGEEPPAEDTGEPDASEESDELDLDELLEDLDDEDAKSDEELAQGDDDESAYRTARTGKPIAEIQPFLDYALVGIDAEDLPEEPNGLDAADEEKYQPRDMPATEFHWAASNLYHYPLYFEDPQLERYGHTYKPIAQPFISAHRFMTQLIGFPYQATIDPIAKRRYTLGWYRPGECAPKLKYFPPWNTKAGIVQAGVTTGLFFLIP